MMKSKKKRVRSKKARKASKGRKQLFKASGVRPDDGTQLVHDPPLTPSEISRVTESRQNIKEGKYKDFATVDDVWKFAESD